MAPPALVTDNDDEPQVAMDGVEGGVVGVLGAATNSDEIILNENSCCDETGVFESDSQKHASVIELVPLAPRLLT